MRKPICLLILLFLAGVATRLHAQTLKQRPPAPPEAQTSPAVPGSKSEAKADAKPYLPEGTSFQVESSRHYPMKKGESIEGRLLHPIFADGRLAVAENTMLHGTLVALTPDGKTRWHGRLRGDFTPFHKIQVQFDELLLPGGIVAISTNGAVNGAPVLHLSAPGATAKQTLIARVWMQARSRVHERVEYFTAPGFGDRALLVLYHQLPYHPERIEAHTAWSFELREPLALPAFQEAVQPTVPAVAVQHEKSEIWSVHAVLTKDLTSASAKPGDPVEALVVEPVFDQNAELVVPQGSKLVGKVGTAKAASSFGRNGKLRFTFQRVIFPEGAGLAVQGSLAGATAESQQSLSLDAEGTITPRNQSNAVAPLLLTMLAGRALDSDGNITAQTGVASNGFGFVGRIVGVASGNRNVAAGIGYYAAALSIYENFLRSGRNVIFLKDTRIEIETNPLRAPVLKPTSQ